MLVIKDFATTTTASALTAAATDIAVVDGSKFPSLAVGDYFYAVIQDFYDVRAVEVVKVIGVSGNVLSVERGQDGTAGRAFSAGAYVELRLTVRTFAEFIAQSCDGFTAALDSRIDAVELGQGAGVIGYATQAELYANLTFDDGSIGYVTNDPTATKNGTYRKSGASGAGSWIQSSGDLASLAYQNADTAKLLNEVLEIQALAKTINMLDATHPTVIREKFLLADGSVYSGTLAYYSISHFIPLREGEQLFLSVGSLPTSSAAVCYYDENLEFVRGEAAPKTIISRQGEHYVRASFKSDVDKAPTLLDVVATTSTTVPLSGIPYKRVDQVGIDIPVPSKDIFPAGKMELTLPLLRSGTISESTTAPKFFGFNKSIKCSASKNTFAYHQASIASKRYVAVMFSKHTGTTNTPITQINVFGSEEYDVTLENVIDVDAPLINIDCGDGVVLHAATVTFAANHNYFYIGTTRVFPNDTAEIFGLALFDKRDNDPTGKKVATAYLADCMSRVQRRKHLDAIKELQQSAGLGGTKSVENYFPSGMFEASYPLTRSGSTIVDVTYDAVNNLGFDKAILQRRTGNEFAYTVDGRIANKRLYAAFMNYSPTGEFSAPDKYTSVEPLGSLGIPKALVVRSTKLSAGLWLHSMIIDVADLQTTLYLGTAKKPETWNSYWFGHYAIDAEGLSTLDDLSMLDSRYLAQVREKLSRKSIVAATRLIPELYTQVEDNADAIARNTDAIGALTGTTGTSVEINGQYTFVRGRQFTRKMRNQLGTTSTTISEVVNYNLDYIGDDQMSFNASSDDVAPIHAFGTTLMANHSYNGNLVTAVGHGKTVADVGSIYTDGTDKYVLVNVESVDTIMLMRTGSNSNGLSTTGTLTFVSGGSGDLADITYTANNFKQCYPCYTDYTVSKFADGTELTLDDQTKGFNSTFTITESYNLLDRQSIYDWYATSYDGTRYPNGESVLNYSGTFRFDLDGNCTQSGYYVAVDSFLMADIMGLQSVRKDSVKYYIPKTLPFEYDGSVVNFALKASSTTCSGGSQKSIFFTPEKLDGSAIPSDRWIQINADGTYFAMGFTPLGDCGLNRAANVTAQTCEIRGNTDKIYPRVVDVGDFITNIGDSWSFVGYRNVGKPQGIETCSYPVRTDGDDFYYIDYHDVTAIDTLTIPTDFVGREFEVVESRNITTYGSVMASRMTFNVSCAGDYGYLVLKVKQ